MAFAPARPDAALLAAVIARSQIVVAEWAREDAGALLPAGYDEVDLAVLQWIAAEGRRAGPGVVQM